VDTFLKMGTTIAFVVSSSFIAGLYYLFEEYESALTLIDKALDHVNSTGNHMHTAEFYRIKGLTLLALGEPVPEVEKNYRKAIELSRKQSAKTFELRASADLARLWQQQGKVNEARRLLQGVYDWFTEGFDFVDLKEASALLAELDVTATSGNASSEKM
jgi:predicted ATPase